MKTKTVPAQHAGMTETESAALLAFEAANESHDLNAFGHGRKTAARRRLVAAWREIERLGLVSALTWKERANARSAVNWCAANNL